MSVKQVKQLKKPAAVQATSLQLPGHRWPADETMLRNCIDYYTAIVQDVKKLSLAIPNTFDKRSETEYTRDR